MVYVLFYIFKSMFYVLFYFQGKKGAADLPGDAERKFDGTGYDSDLVDMLERDIVSRNPSVHWYVTMHQTFLFPCLLQSC